MKKKKIIAVLLTATLAAGAASYNYLSTNNTPSNDLSNELYADANLIKLTTDSSEVNLDEINPDDIVTNCDDITVSSVKEDQDTIQAMVDAMTNYSDDQDAIDDESDIEDGKNETATDSSQTSFNGASSSIIQCATSKETSIDPCAYSRKVILNLGSLKIPLYPTFDDSEAAIKSVKDKYATFLSEIKNKYELSEMTNENLEKYQEAIYKETNTEDAVDWSEEYTNTYIALSSFFDIYENNRLNNYLVNKAISVNDISQLYSDTEFMTSLPYYAVDAITGTEGVVSLDNSTIDDSSNIKEAVANSYYQVTPMSYSTSSAVDYAIEHASGKKPTNPNFAAFSNDCTNFVSQVAWAGGKSMTTNWYSRYISGVNWEYTRSWTVANDFVNYWGKDYTFSTHSSFAKKIKKGDYIGVDYENDGKWNHMGFVVKKGTDGTYDGYKYCDYKVAQHNRAYLLWTSNPKNNWEKIKSEHKNAKFCIVRM